MTEQSVIREEDTMKRALVLVDLGRAFFRDGGLPVSGAEETIPGVKRTIMDGDEQGSFDFVGASYEDHSRPLWPEHALGQGAKH